MCVCVCVCVRLNGCLCGAVLACVQTLCVCVFMCGWRTDGCDADSSQRRHCC